MNHSKIAGIFFAPKICDTMANFLTAGSIVAWLGALCAVLMLAEANAFTTEAQPAPASRNEQKANVIVFDNAYLDKRFAQTRITETVGVQQDSSLSANSGQAGHAVRAFMGAGLLEVAPNTSLLKGMTRRTSARRAAGLRLAENGRKAVQNKQYRKAIYYLEKALGIDTSPFVHFYLARAHYHLADYPRSLGFLEVAESGFAGQSQWLSELAALRRALSAASIAMQEAPKRDVSWTTRID
jgi:tetratricopeptide (TPR) repeat protein